MSDTEQAAETQPVAAPREQIAVIWADFANRTVQVEFSVDFYQKSLEEQASIAEALIQAAVDEHVDAQDARIDALTALPEAEPASDEELEALADYVGAFDE